VLFVAGERLAAGDTEGLWLAGVPGVEEVALPPDGGGRRSLILSRRLASSNDAILWLGSMGPPSAEIHHHSIHNNSRLVMGGGSLRVSMGVSVGVRDRDQHAVTSLWSRLHHLQLRVYDRRPLRTAQRASPVGAYLPG